MSTCVFAGRHERMKPCPRGQRYLRYLRIATGVAAWHSWRQLWNSIPENNDDFTWH
jgi:hypothetical protein